MRTRTRDRLLLPILLPVGILVLLAAVLFGFSRILLSLTKDAATATALVVAFSILVVAAVASARTAVRASSLAAMLGAIAGVAMLAGGIALIAVGKVPKPPPAPPAATLQLAAKGLAFSTKSLSAPADKPFAIAFQNEDASIQHDVQIFDNQSYSGSPLFDGAVITGPAKVTYMVKPLAKGTYFFRCVIHPLQMKGTLVVKPAPGGGGGGGRGGGGPSTTVTAQNLAFDTKEIDLPASAPSTIHFENNDPGQTHNISIFQDSTRQTNLFRGQATTGPASVDYLIPALPPGTYFFQCDYHAATMNGKVVVR
jgi:plastocyanin